MTEYYETDEDPDTLAILYRGDVKVRFIVADDLALGTNDYRVLLWDKSNVVVGISSSYSRDIIDEFVVSKVTMDMIEHYDEDIKTEVVREMAVKHLCGYVRGLIRESCS